MSRTRYVYRPDENGHPVAVEVSSDFESTRGLQAPLTDLYMDGVRATDGTDIGSRPKRAAYMRANNLADADDFTGVWAKAQSERERERQGLGDRRERVEAVRDAVQRLRAGKR